ncbi:hypothetical protein [Synechococcus sp. PCC 7336]|uniref:hypothetical protein n=1 Tax=Synechococcus sp. PCC 7336 TaxID=195250 RepID=UPI000346346D|nr:hypothetical protein [Synechococcus sp. PCC 7336]
MTAKQAIAQELEGLSEEQLQLVLRFTKALQGFAPVEMTPDERAEAFLAWAKQPRRKLPVLSDEAISRESLYGERG